MISHSVAQRIAKIIPRLATNHDGEVIASVRAIERILAHEGHDLHALASIIEIGDKPLQAFTSTSTRSWRHLPDAWRAHLLTQLMSAADLSDWEQKFITSITRQFNRGFCLSEKQIEIIDRLATRASTARSAA